MSNATEPVLNLWRALAKRDWEAVKAVVSDDCIFVDMSLGPTVAARGPDNIVKRLKVGLENENLANYANHDALVLTNGVDVMYEHLETSRRRTARRRATPLFLSTMSATARYLSGRPIGTSTQSPTPCGFKAAQHREISAGRSTRPV